MINYLHTALLWPLAGCWSVSARRSVLKSINVQRAKFQIRTEMDQQQQQVDNRMDFLANFVKKTLKLKPEKFTRMMATEEHKSVVMKFLERPVPALLVIALTPTAQLVASNGFPLVQLKSKGKYVHPQRRH